MLASATIAPFLSKQYRIIPTEIDLHNKIVLVDYVDVIDDKRQKDIEFILKNFKIKFNNKINEETFDTEFKEIYLSTTPKKIKQVEAEPPKKEILHKYTEDVQETQESVGLTDFLKEIPLGLLETELRRRYLSVPGFGKITVNKDGVNFTLDELKWPVGDYKIRVEVVEDVTEKGKTNE